MFKDRFFIFPVHENPQDICDFKLQTIRILTQNKNKVLVIEKNIITSWKDIFKKKDFPIKRKENFLYFKYFYLLPKKIEKLISPKIVKEINITFNEIISELIVFILSFNKKTYEWIFEIEIVENKIKLKKREKILDIVDFTNFEKNKKNIENANFVFTNSQTLKKEIKKTIKKKINLVPQGFDLDTFSQAKTTKTKNKIVKVGFVGAISNRIDFNLMTKLAKKLPEINFIFVGPIRNDLKIKKNKSKQIKNFIKIKNVKKISSQKKEKIAQIINNFDIAIIPYDTSEKFNLNSYPMKTFEYLYLEKPVISTPIKELKNKKFKGLVHIASNEKEWQKSISKILKNKNPDIIKKKAKKLAIENSWENKITKIAKTVEK